MLTPIIFNRYMKTRQEIINSKIIKPEDFLWKRYTPSTLIKNKFYKIFSLFYRDFSDKFIIINLIFEETFFRILLEYKDTQELLNFYIKDNKWNKDCNYIYCTDNIVQVYIIYIQIKKLIDLFYPFIKNEMNLILIFLKITNTWS